MALSEFEKKRCEKAIAAFMQKRRPPPHIRKKLDLGYRIKDQSIEIFEIRPFWRNSEERIEHAVAKATYVKTKGIWKVYWQRADLKWHKYDPGPEAHSVEEFLEKVDEDARGCFFG